LAPNSNEPQQPEWFEVFFDLIFAVAVAFWAERVATEPTLGAYARGASYLVPIWWVWLGQTAFATRFPAGSRTVQALSIVQVVSVGLMASQLFHDRPDSVSFPLAFVAARASLLTMYARAARLSPEARAVARVYFIGFGTGASIWAVSALLPAHLRPYAWVLGIMVDFATPWIGRPTLARVPIDFRHLASRVGVFNSLLLYVAMEGIVRALADKGLHPRHVAASLLAFTLVVALWWIYAGRVNTADLRSVRGGIAQPYLYSQFLVVLGVGTCSIGIRALGEDHREALTLLAAGVFFWIGGLVLIRAVVLRHRDRYWYAPFVAALLVVPLLVTAGFRPLITFALFDAIVLVLLAIELRHGRGHSGPEHHL
jgi:low temperature requirement protein LtrA